MIYFNEKKRILIDRTSSFQDAEKLFNQKEDKLEIENNRMNRKSADDEMEEDPEVEEVDSDEWDEEDEDAIPPNDCLFCDHHSSTIDKVTLKDFDIDIRGKGWGNHFG